MITNQIGANAFKNKADRFNGINFKDGPTILYVAMGIMIAMVLLKLLLK